MASQKYPTDIIEQANDVLAACRQISETMRTGKLSQEEFAAALTQIQQRYNQISALEMQLVHLRNQRDIELIEIWDNVKRTRALVKGLYGDDSSEYELIGGTRVSERKRIVRRSTVE